MVLYSCPLTGIYEHNDYAEITPTATETSYVIGTNANAARAKSWPVGLQAEDLLFYATVNCHVRFEDADAVQHLIPAGTYIRFHQRCYRIYVVGTGGTLHVWSEG